MSYKWPGIPNGDYSFDHGRAVWNKLINYLRRLSEKLDADIVDATVDRRGMMTAADKDKLDGVEPGAEVNQNAFSGVKVGNSTIEAGSKTDVVELVAGNAITLTADAAAKRLTVAVTDNTFETISHAAATYEKQDHAADTYETKTHASATYETKGNAITGLSASGTTVTYTKGDGTTGTFETQDHDTIYTHPEYTALTGKPTTNQTPGFGDMVTVSQVKSDGTGHVTAMDDRTITIPATEATQSAAGLMSAMDKIKLDGITAGAVPIIIDNLGYDYVMTATDFVSPGLYKCPRLAASPSGNTPESNTGDYYLWRVDNGSIDFAVIVLYSPRLNDIYIGHFWETVWRGWSKIPSSLATVSVSGLMSAADKVKLDSVVNKGYTVVNGTAVSMANNTQKNLAQYTFTKTGIYLVHYSIAYQAVNTTGNRVLLVSSSSTGSSISDAAVINSPPSPAGYTFVNLMRIESISSANTTRYLNAKQTSGAAMNGKGMIMIARLGDV